MSDKFAKELGVLRPSSQRRLDHEPPKVTPKKILRAKVRKLFGYESRARHRDYRTGEWSRWSKWYSFHWYATPAQRDQAMNSYHGYWTDPGRRESQVRPVERNQERGQRPTAITAGALPERPPDGSS
jgi:hypothetical protein